MKKIAIFFVIIIFVVVTMLYIYINYKDNYNNIQQENKQFEYYYNQEIYGAVLATIINKAMDNNYKNNVEKDSNGKYIQNDNNSICIDIKIIDNNTTYNMEKIFYGGISNFTTYYNQIKFKCTKIEHHQSTGKISYMLFEQITQ